MWLSTCSSLHFSSSISPTVLSSFSSHITVVAGEPRDNQLALALWTFCEGSQTHEVGCIFHLGDSTYICINLVLLRTYIRSMRLTFPPLFAFAFLFFKLDSIAFSTFVLAFSALVLIWFVLVPEPAVFSSEFVSETSSVAFFVISPSFCLLWRWPLQQVFNFSPVFLSGQSCHYESSNHNVLGSSYQIFARVSACALMCT